MAVDFNALPTVIAVVGSRDYPKMHHVHSFGEQIKPGTIVVSGGARGVDQAIAATCRKRGDIFVKEFLVEGFEWNRLGKRAGHIRNYTMLSYLKHVQGQLFAFAALDEHGERTPGTENAIATAIAFGIPYEIFEERL